MMEFKKKSRWLPLLVMFLTPFLLLGCIDSMGCDCDQIVKTEKGVVRGTENELARMYKGIPFAAPPVGDLRWKAPQDPEPWDGVLDAAQSADMCTQPGRMRTWHPILDEDGNIVVLGSEDCLYLDIYRPKNDDENLPVYVFFHGGSNVFGNAAAFDGSHLAGEQNIIVVVAQYRLGPLGWLQHSSLRQEEDLDCSDEDLECQAQEFEIKKNNSGNYALLDNIKALEWVQSNIADFGGDPARVTVGGQSAGASNVQKMLSSPLAEGLFRGAFLQSPGGVVVPVEEGDRRTALMLEQLEGSGDVEEIGDFLYSKSAAELVAAYRDVDVDGDGTADGTISGFADGTILFGTHVEAIFDDDYNKVPIVIGSTQSEAGDFLPLLFADSENHSTWAKAYDLFDPDFLPEETSWVDVFPSVESENAYKALNKVYSLGYKARDIDELSRMLKQRQDSVYSYLFRWGELGSASDEFATVFGAAHSMDLPLFFGANQSFFGYALTDENRLGFEAIQDVMMTYLANFVKNGSPGTVADKEWIPWSNVEGGPKSIVFDADFENAIVDMNSDEIFAADLPGLLAADMAGLAPADVGLVSYLLTTYKNDYYLNEYGYDLLSSRLQIEPSENATIDAGIHEQAGYVIEMPDAWNGDLVLYAHGYSGTAPQLSVTPPGRIRSYLINSGYAWAASSYTRNGYDIAAGVKSTDDLLELFRERYGLSELAKVYLTGHSMGGHVTARTITDIAYKDKYDGALPMCGVVGGGNELFSYQMDWGLLASYYAGVEADVPYKTDDENYGDEISAYVTAITGGALGDFPSNLNDAGNLFKTAVMYRSGGERPLFDRAFSSDAARFNAQMMTFYPLPEPFGAGYLADPVYRFDPELGNIAGNSLTLYELDAIEGISNDEEELLNDEQNGIERVAAPIEANFDGPEIMWPVNGDIDIPVLTMHTLGDLYVPFSMVQIWADKIAAAGNEEKFRARAIRTINHCNFTPQEEIEAFSALVNWVETGDIPEGDDVTNSEIVRQPEFGCTFTRPMPDLVAAGLPVRDQTVDDPEYDAVCGN